MAALIRNSLLRLKYPVIPQAAKQCRQISTSKKNSETATVRPEAAAAESTPATHPVTDFKRNWVSYGFDEKSKEDDTNYHNATFFFTVTLCLVIGGTSWAYMPDSMMGDWASREAFLELRRRESLGLPLVDPNYIDPAKMILPSEEELGDTELII